jgi:hypothetical protein
MAGVARGLDIVPKFTESEGQAWSDQRKAVVLQAISDYEKLILEKGKVKIEFKFCTSNGRTAMWYVTGPSPRGATIRPWSRRLRHVIMIDESILDDQVWFDPTPATDDDVPAGAYDALTLFRHELGHAMGHRNGYCVDNHDTPKHVDRWMVKVNDKSVFDADGLNVQLVPGNVGHVAGADLMCPMMAPGARYSIDDTVRRLVVAYEYKTRLDEDTSEKSQAASITGGLLAALWVLTVVGAGAVERPSWDGPRGCGV